MATSLDDPRYTAALKRILDLLEGQAREFARGIKDEKNVEIQVTKARFDQPDVELRWRFGGAECNIHMEVQSRESGHKDIRLGGAVWWDAPDASRLVKTVEASWFDCEPGGHARRSLNQALAERLKELFSRVCALASGQSLSHGAHR